MEGDLLFLESIRDSLGELLGNNEYLVLLGEDIVDPYGGAFKVTKGLSSKWPNRVIATPISEGAVTGIGIGLAMRGFTSIVEIMFGDFISLCADQLVNHAAKFRYMYGSNLDIPLVIRTPTGAGRGYGPTHSQSLEKMFLGIPGLMVVAPSLYHNPGQLLRSTVLSGTPSIFIEHKLLYSLPLRGQQDSHSVETHGSEFPIVQLKNYPKGKNPDLTIITYGGVSRFIEEVSSALANEELWVDIFLPSRLNRFDANVVSESVVRSGRCLICEDGYPGFGWGAQVCVELYDSYLNLLKKPIRVVSGSNRPIPASFQKEADVILTSKKIVDSCMELYN